MDFVLADIEGDGDLDITVLSGRSGRIEPGQAQGEVAILAGDGKGGFTLAGAMGMDFRPAAFSLLRFDGDGADVALVSEQRPAVHLASLETGAPASLDLNADGIPDECVATIFARGDVDASGALDLTDAIALLWSLFLGAEPPGCEKAADADDDGELKITDAVSILGHLFLGGARLPEPSGDCGSDPTDDALTCASSSACDR
jgi:hypothetical protein